MESRSYARMLLRYPAFKTKAITLSYDDGRIFDRKMVEILDQYHLKCTFNLNSGKLIDDHHVTAQEVPDLYRNHEVAVHSLSHPHLEDLCPGNIAYQIIEDRKNLEDILHKPVEGMAYPYGLVGKYPEMVDTIGNCGIRYARTTHNTRAFQLPMDYLRWHPTCHQMDPQLFEIIEQFQKPIETTIPGRIRLQLLYIWGHSYEYEHDWERLEAMCRKVAGDETVWYATNGAFIDYLDAYRHLRPSADGKYVYNPTATRIWVCTDNGNQILEPGTTTEI